MTYECWWDKQYGDQYAIRLENGRVTGWHKLSAGEEATAETVPWLAYDGEPGNIAFLETMRSHAEVLLSVEVR
jgi:hypothetical protein